MVGVKKIYLNKRDYFEPCEETDEVIVYMVAYKGVCKSYFLL